MNENRIWIVVLGVAVVGLAILGRNVLADPEPNQVGRELALDAKILSKNRTPIQGSSRAPYTLAEFMDYECGPCRAFHDQLNPLLQRGRISLIVRHSPGRSIHPFADRAARYALSVGDGPAAGTAHDLLFKLRWSEEGWKNFIKSNKKKSVRSPKEIALLLNEDEAVAKAAKVRMTPQLFLIHNDRVYEVSSPDALASL